MAKANKTRYAVLGVLANAPASSGYDIQSIMKESTDFFWKETFSSIYPVLEALKKEGLVSELDSSANGRNRKAYKVTKEGFKVLQSWLLEDVELEQSRNELLLKVFLGDLNSIESSIRHVDNYKRQILERKGILELSKKTLAREHQDSEGLPFWLIAVEFGIRRLQASLDWSEYALEKLTKLKKITNSKKK